MYTYMDVLSEINLIIYMYVYIKHILYNTNIFFISLLNAFQLYLLRAAIYIYIYILKTKVNQKVTITFIKSTYIQLK